MSHKTYVLDSYAILALLRGEPGSDVVSRLLNEAEQGDCRLLVAWVNVGEVACIVERRWGHERFLQVLTSLDATAIEFVDVGRDLSLAAARIKATHPMAYSDALAAALAKRARAPIVTGDPEFKALEDVVQIEWLGGCPSEYDSAPA